MITVTTFPPHHRHPLAPAFQAAQIAVLPAQPVLSVITARLARLLWAVPVSVMASPARVTELSSTVGALAVDTVTIPVLAVPQVVKKNITLEVLDATV